jgi:hemophore-related protein
MIKKLLVTVGAGSGRVAVGALGVVAVATIATAPASAEPQPQPQCTAAVLSSTLGPVASATGDYLTSHPDANQVVTAAGSQSQVEGETSIKVYFATHPEQWLDLKAIGQPLTNLRKACPSAGNGPPPDLGKLFDAMATP